jgi:glucokinase
VRGAARAGQTLSYALRLENPLPVYHRAKLRFVKSSEHTVIGVDVGGTKVAAGLMRARLPVLGSGAAVPEPAMLAHVVAATNTATPDDCLEGIASAIARLASDAGVEGIGVGTASMVNVDQGRIVDSVNLPLADVPLRDILQERFGVPAAIDNDATVAAIGEWAFGAGAGTQDMLMLTLGTGVGGGIIARGRPYRGYSGAAAELGHIIIDINGLPCPANCPGRGCLEAYASGTAMGAAAIAAAQERPLTALGRAFAAGEVVDSRLLTRLALDGDPLARELITRAGEYLGGGLVTLVNAFNPERIVIGGGAAAAGELLLDPARRVLARRALRPARDEVSVVLAALGPNASMIGAASLALMELFPDASAPLS